MALVRASAADILSVYVGKSGGIGPARKIAAVAEAAGLTCTVGSNLELGIASAAMERLATATTGIGAEEFPCDILDYRRGLTLSIPIDRRSAATPG
jgi:L-alanine-DL-glutamate epimerase-like enolase superfamily enzyme